MQPKYAITAVVAAWLLGLGIIAVFTALGVVTGWILLLGWALIPPLILIRLRRQQEQSLSESIREAIR